MASRRKKHLLHELAGLPWWASIVVAVVVYVAIRWLLPAVGGSNVILRGLGEGLRDKAWMFAAPFVVVAGVAAVNAWYRRHLFDTQSGIESLRAMTWQDFERLVGEAFRRQGYVVEEVGGAAADGGFDLVLHRQGRKVIVQCKRWRSTQVGVVLIREFFGVVVAEKAARGVFVTTGTFTSDAVAFARGKPLELVDGTRLAVLVTGLQPGQSNLTQAPPGVPEEQSISTENAPPACPRCGGSMVRRIAKRGVNVGGEFWGCLRYPKCSGTRDIEVATR